jgi:hypothetical protein
MKTICDLISDYAEIIAILDRQIAFFERDRGASIGPCSATPEQARAVADAWLKKLRKWRSEYVEIIAELRRVAADT